MVQAQSVVSIREQRFLDGLNVKRSGRISSNGSQFLSRILISDESANWQDVIFSLLGGRKTTISIKMKAQYGEQQTVSSTHTHTVEVSVRVWNWWSYIFLQEEKTVNIKFVIAYKSMEIYLSKNLRVWFPKHRLSLSYTILNVLNLQTPKIPQYPTNVKLVSPMKNLSFYPTKIFYFNWNLLIFNLYITISLAIYKLFSFGK